MQHTDEDTVLKQPDKCLPFPGNRKAYSPVWSSGNQASIVHLRQVEPWDQVCARHE